MKIVAGIPARLGSKHLPGKGLADIPGWPRIAVLLERHPDWMELNFAVP